MQSICVLGGPRASASTLDRLKTDEVGQPLFITPPFDCFRKPNLRTRPPRRAPRLLLIFTKADITVVLSISTEREQRFSFVSGYPPRETAPGAVRDEIARTHGPLPPPTPPPTPSKRPPPLFRRRDRCRRRAALCPLRLAALARLQRPRRVRCSRRVRASGPRSRSSQSMPSTRPRPLPPPSRRAARP
jgi:hypothetical protein